MAARAEPLARGDELVVQADGGRREEAVGEIPAANGQELAQDGRGKRGGARGCGIATYACTRVNLAKLCFD